MLASASEQGAQTARERGLARCHLCGTVSPVSRGDCPQCGKSLHLRKPDSLARTWALLIAAIILYIPANVYPVMTVKYLGDGTPDTIISGAIHLIEAGDVPIALLVLFASVLVPLMKLILLAFLLISVQRKSKWQPRTRTRIFRLLELVGRWSMIDVFMISILAALVQLGSLATITGGPGGTAFAAVVVLTMLAAHSFDARLIWDAAVPGGEATLV